jgi:hypothetical protein
MSTPSEASAKSTCFDTFSNRSTPTSFTSSQDPGHVPTPYRHDSGIDHEAPISYACNTSIKNPFIHEGAPDIFTSHWVADLEPSTESSVNQHSNPPSNFNKETAIPYSPGGSSLRTDSALDAIILNLTGSSDGESQAVSPVAPLRKNIFKNKEGLPISSGTFINGAGTVGPHASIEPNDELQRRARDADFSLTQKQKTKIIKAEGEYSFTVVLV